MRIGQYVVRWQCFATALLRRYGCLYNRSLPPLLSLPSNLLEHPSTCQQVLVPVLFERGSASFSSPLFSGCDPPKKMPPQRVQREHRRYNPCDCNHHKDLYKDWPSENATWRLASCMRRCPDKNCLSEEFKSASHLRRHAKTPFHKDLGIKVEKETPKYSRRVILPDSTHCRLLTSS